MEALVLLEVAFSLSAMWYRQPTLVCRSMLRQAARRLVQHGPCVSPRLLAVELAQDLLLLVVLAGSCEWLELWLCHRLVSECRLRHRQH